MFCPVYISFILKHNFINFRHHKGVITTLSASRKLFDEIVPRLRGNPGGYVNRVKLTKIIEHREPEDYVIRGYRRGDGVSTSYVEINLK